MLFVKMRNSYLDHPLQHLPDQILFVVNLDLGVQVALDALDIAVYEFVLIHAFSVVFFSGLNSPDDEVEDLHVFVVGDFCLGAAGGASWSPRGSSSVGVGVVVVWISHGRVTLGVDWSMVVIALFSGGVEARNFVFLLVDLDVVFLHADDGLSKEVVGLADKGGDHLVDAVGFGNGLAESDHALKLPDCDAVAVAANASLGIVCSEVFVFLDQQGFCIRCELGLEGAGEADVALELLCGEFRGDCFVTQLVDADNMLGQMAVDGLIAFVEDHEEQVESRHDGRAHVDVGPEGRLAVVSASYGIGGGEDTGASVESGLDAGFGYRDGLLFHGFVDGHLVCYVHLVKLVNGTDAVVSEHESPGFDGEFSSLFVFDNGGCETSSG
jgi:hypothetical protein